MFIRRYTAKVTQLKYRIIEILCVAALIVFIIMLCVSRSGGTDKDIKAISSPVVKTISAKQMTKKSNADAVKTLKIDLSKTEGVVYYANDNVMNVSELFIAKLNNSDDSEEFKEKIELRVEEQKKLYKSYAPKQYSLLENSVIETSGNTVFYCVSKNAGTLAEIFKNSL